MYDYGPREKLPYRLGDGEQARVAAEVNWALAGGWAGQVSPWHHRNRYRLSGLLSRGAVSERDYLALLAQWDACKEDPIRVGPVGCFDQLLLAADGVVGDCWRTALGCLLGMPPETLPHFVEIALTDDVPELVTTQRWLRLRDLELRETSDPPRRHTGLVVASGVCPRGGCHAVVWDPVEGVLHHDPHPSRAGLVGEPTAYFELNHCDAP